MSILENIQQNNDYYTSKDWQTANSLHKCFSGYCLDMGKREKETTGWRQFFMKLYKQENDRREEKNGKWEFDVTNIKQTK